MRETLAMNNNSECHTIRKCGMEYGINQMKNNMRFETLLEKIKRKTIQLISENNLDSFVKLRNQVYTNTVVPND